MFDANVMVEVATKKARNPVSSRAMQSLLSRFTISLLQVAVMGDTLNMPDIVKSRPPLSLPGKLLVPRLEIGCLVEVNS